MSKPDSEAIVRAFFAGMGPTIESFRKTYDELMTDDVVWESVGGVAHVGKQACLDELEMLHDKMGIEYCTIDVKHLAASGDVVLTERIDRMHRADGSVIFDFAFRIMGTIELRDGKICRYTDYYDSLGFARVAGRI